jgi:hypothetical protein
MVWFVQNKMHTSKFYITFVMDGLLQAGWNGKPGNNYFILDGKNQLLQVSGDTEQKAKDRCNHGSYTMAKPLKKAEIIAQLQAGNSEREGLRM